MISVTDSADVPGATSPASRRGRRRAVLLGLVGVASLGVVVAGIALAASATTSRAPLIAQPERPIQVPVPSDLHVLDESVEDLAYAPIAVETGEWLDRLQNAVAGDPSFGTVAISADRGTVTITWYGDPSDTLRHHLDAAPDDLEVVLQPAAFVPAELAELVGLAMTPDLVPGVKVALGGVENDASGIHLGIHELPAGTTLDQVGRDVAAAIGRPDVPVSVEVTGPVVPLGG